MASILHCNKNCVDPLFTMNEILSIGQTRQSDAFAENAGVPGFSLMRAAGAAVAREARRVAPLGRITVLCGPGNNGGDGYVVAAALREAGRSVSVYALGDPAALKGDAAKAAALWGETIRPLSEAAIGESDVVVDALFGAGLTRPLEGDAARLAEACAQVGALVIAADVPSGLDGDTGEPRGEGPCFRADVTVTFFRKKPAHVLVPGREICGEIVVADIGIPEAAITALAPALWENDPDLWAGAFPWPASDTHKHRRGRLAVLCGPALGTGAARLACAGGRRAGAGFTTLFGGEDALRVAAARETGTVLHAAEAGAPTADAIRGFGAAAAVLGPGAGTTAATRDSVTSLLEDGPPLILDADALTVFADAPERLFEALRGDCLLTPHEGEFARIFPDLAEGAGAGSKIDRARAAAARAGAVVLLKGPDTVVAAPDGRAMVNTTTTPFLASAGTGDVLAGIAGGLVAQGMPVFEAGCAATWLHGRAGIILGPGLIAEDLPDVLPEILAELQP